jgi:hypothetical protein
MRERFPVGVCVAVILLSLLPLSESSGPAATSSPSLPRSRAIPQNKRQHTRPWNPSNHIDVNGFLSGLYDRIPGEWEEEVRLQTSFGTDFPCQIRQVPGDGNCLFHSISLCLQYAANGTHWDLNTSDRRGLDALYEHSQTLRRKAVEVLQHSQRRLFLQGRESLRAHELVQAAAQQYNLSPEEYCASMQQDSVWGGGPEIVALCNVLQRPIHVYELASTTTRSSRNDDERQSFVLRRMACFGSPKFDRRQPLHILSADSRFPDVTPGQQLASGNHFLALFPHERKVRRKQRLRGGFVRKCVTVSSARQTDQDDEPHLNEDEGKQPAGQRRHGRFTQWWRQLLLSL